MNSQATCQLPDGPLEVPLNVTGIGTLGTVNSIESVTVNITHRRVNELRIELIAPDGVSSIILFYDNGIGFSEDLNNTVFSDLGPALNTGTAPFTGTFSPKEPLRYFNSNAVNADGQWTLKICDLITGDTGILNAWNITFGPTPTCLPPSLPSISNIDYNSADLSWTNGATENAWEIEAVNLTNSEVADQSVDFSAAVNPFTLTNLAVNSDYAIYVRAVCAGNDSSPWAGPVFFTTALPNNTINGAIPITPTDFQSGCNPFVLPFDIQGTTSSGLASSCHDGSSVYVDQFFTWTATTNALFWDDLDPSRPGIVIRDNMGNEIDCQGFTFGGEILGGWNVGDELIIQLFDFIGNGSNGLETISFCLSEFSLATCLPPENITATNVSFDEITIAWDESDLPTATPWDATTTFTIEFGPTGFTQGSGTIITGITEQSHLMTGFLENTSYDFYVQAYCNANGTSDWSAPLSVTTIYEPPTNDNVCDAIPVAMNSESLYDNFGATRESTFELGATCFVNDLEDIKSVWFTFQAPASGEVRIRTDKKETGIVTLTNTEVAVFELTSACDTVFAVNGFTELACDQNSGAGGQLFFNSNFVVSGLTAGNTYYIEVNSEVTIQQGTFYLQVFDNNPPAPTCIPPVFSLSDIVYNDSSNDWETNISWTPQTGDTNWDIEVINTTDGETFTGNPTISNTTTNPYTLGNLDLGKDYQVRMRTHCSDGQVSAWSTAIDFAPAFNDTFATALPIDVYENTGCDTPFSLNRDLATDSGMDGSCDGAAMGIDQFYTWTATSETLLWNTLADGYPGIVVRDVMGNEIDCAGTNADPNHVLSGWTIGDELILQVYDAVGGFQDVEFCLEIPNCQAPSNITTTSITHWEAYLEWTENGIVGNWNIEYGPTGYTQGSGTLVTETITTTSYRLFGLQSETTYDVYVQGDCTNGNATTWAGPYTFTTAINPPFNDDICDALPLTFDRITKYSNRGASAEANETNPANTICFGDYSSLQTVWFTFVAPASGQVRIRTDFVSPETTLYDTELAIYDIGASSCSNYFTNGAFEIACDQDSGDGVGYPNNSDFTVSGLTAGQTYYLQVNNNSVTSPEGDFLLQITDTTQTTDTIGMVGTALNGWPDVVNMTPDIVMLNTQPGLYRYYGYAFSNGEMKFRTNFDWGQPSYGGDSFPFESTFTGDNVPVTEGVYDVFLNFNTNIYSFVASTEFPRVGIIGPAANGWSSPTAPAPDIEMTTTDGIHYELLNQYLTTGDAKFRENYAWSINYGEASFPTGTAVQENGANIPIVAGTYNIFFNRITKTYEFVSTKVQLSPKVYLQGAVLNPNTGEETLMRDDLRQAGLIPTTSPYADMRTCEATVFTTTGADAIVDWVWVELRDENNAASIITAQSALLQRDGNIVDVDGISTITFDASPKNYFIVIKHRNHLSVMSATAIALSAASTSVDFSNPATTTFGTNAQTNAGMPIGVVALWSGDANGDAIVQYSGTSPDTPTILATVLNAAGNFLNFPTFTVNGYSNDDINMNGSAQYSGTNPDTPFILQNVLAHPGNFLNFSTYQILEQLPGN
ncbi:MAG: fibronectin type III domain-containing protein [Bacteroidota bacterium]